jgi:NDP-sugar pyrophosphorylase family protein
MSDRLHEILAQCAIIHETNIKTNIIDDLDKIQENLSEGESDVREHYLTLLMQYYFQKNKLEQLKQLLLEGYKFDMRFLDIVEAFCHLKDDEDNVIEFLEDNVVMLKDSITDDDLRKMYEYYQANLKYKNFIEEPLSLIKKNRYVCVHANKSKEEFAKFFLNEDLLESLKRDMPFLLN